MDFITTIDLSIMSWIQENLRSPLMDSLMIFFTRIGDLMALWILIIFIILLLRKDKRNALQLLLSLILTFIVSELLLKNIVKRPRPFVENSHLPSLLKQPNTYSFPSSHSSTSFAVATSLTFINKLWGLFAYPLAFLIAFSRVYLNVHHPSDVLVGMLVGVIVSIIINKVIAKKY